MSRMTRLATALLGAAAIFPPAEASAQLVDTEKTGVGQNVSQEIENLPTGRNFESLVNTTPGVLTDQLPAQTGQTADGTRYMIDGMAIIDPLPAGSDPTSVDLDAIQEVDVIRRDAGAEFGRAAGGAVNIVTKTGSNEFQNAAGGPLKLELNETPRGTCVESVGGLLGGDWSRGKIKFEVPFQIPKNFFPSQPLGPGGSIYVPPCEGTEAPSFFLQGNFPRPGTPTHTVLSPRGGYNIDLEPLIRAGINLDRSLVDKSFVVGTGSSFGMDWSKDFKLDLFSGTRSDWGWGQYGRYRISDSESPQPQDRIFINYQYYNNTPSACPGIPGKVFGFEGTFRDGPRVGATIPLQPSALGPTTCDEIGRTIENLAEATQEPYQATLGGYIVRDRLWFFAAAPGEEGELRDDLGVGEIDKAAMDLYLSYRNFSETVDNVPSVNSFGLLPGVQGGGLEVLNMRTGAVDLPLAPGGGAGGPHESEPMIYIEALGGPTGEVYQVTIVGDAPVDLNGYAAIEPVAVSSREREEIVEQLEEAPGPRRTFKANGYCRDFLMAPPPAGAVFRLANAAEQAEFEPQARVLEAARRLYEGNLLNVDSDPDGYFHSIRQWALWSVTEGFDQEGFIAAFSKQVQTNLEAGGQAWTDPVAAAVRRHGESRWRDIQQVLELAERP